MSIKLFHHVLNMFIRSLKMFIASPILLNIHFHIENELKVNYYFSLHYVSSSLMLQRNLKFSIQEGTFNKIDPNFLGVPFSEHSHQITNILFYFFNRM